MVLILIITCIRQLQKNSLYNFQHYLDLYIVSPRNIIINS